MPLLYDFNLDSADDLAQMFELNLFLNKISFR